MTGVGSLPRTPDAVVVVPGIMGSELVETMSGRQLWGLSDPRWYVEAWSGDRSLRALHMSSAEEAGEYGRIRATALLRVPSFAPLLRGIEPYGRLVKAIREVALHSDAVLEFPYDWRLPVTYNAGLLAATARRHLDAWRSHPARRGGDARLVIVAHSMGGLLARKAVAQIAVGEVRRVVTLGTPFFGAVKAAAILATGRGSPLPLPRRRLQALAVRLPALYDLLPTFRCVDLGADARSLTSADVAALGGDAALADRAAANRPVELGHTDHLFQHVVGTHQPTMQSLSFDANDLMTHEYTCSPASGGLERTDLAGDGTVHRQSGQLPGALAIPLPQTHGALSKSTEALAVVQDILLDATTRPWLGAQELGLGVPDVIAAGEPLVITITGADHPRDIQCRVSDIATGRPVAIPPAAFANGQITASAVLAEPGLYRVELAGGGMSAVSEVVLVSAVEN